MEFWNSLAKVDSLYNLLRIAAVISALLAALANGGLIVVANRRDKLRNETSSARFRQLEDHKVEVLDWMGYIRSFAFTIEVLVHSNGAKIVGRNVQGLLPPTRLIRDDRTEVELVSDRAFVRPGQEEEGTLIIPYYLKPSSELTGSKVAELARITEVSCDLRRTTASVLPTGTKVDRLRGFVTINGREYLIVDVVDVLGEFDKKIVIEQTGVGFRRAIDAYSRASRN